MLALFRNWSYFLSFTTPNPRTFAQTRIAYSWFHRYHGHATNACWTLQNLLPYLLEEGKNNLAGFFVDNRNLRIFKDPLPGRVKPTAQRLCSNRSHKDDCRKMPGLYSNNSSGTLRSKPWKKRCYTIVTRTGPRPQMLWNTFPSLPRAAARPSNQLPPYDVATHLG